MARKYSTEEVIKTFKEKHGDRYDYSKYQYPGNRHLKSIVICEDHGEFEVSKSHHEKGVGCPECAGVPRGGFKKRTQVEFLSNVEKIFGSLYDFSKFIYVNNTTKGVVVCPLHGDFEKTPKHLISRKQGCPECSGKKKLTLDKIRSKVDYYIPEQKYVDNKTHITAECPLHGRWEVRPDNLLHSKTRCPICANSVSKIEEELRNFISSIGVDIVTNDRTILYPNELDIYLPKYQLAIEMNGLYHHSNLNNKDKNYHLSKTDKCNQQNISLLHIFEDEWRNEVKQNIWKSMIKHRMHLSKKIYARKTVIKKVSDLEKNIFLSKNHLQGNSPSSVNLGLYENDALVSILTMGKSRYNNNYEWEVLRYCNLLNTSVVGGFQKLLKHFIDSYSPKSIITYADKRYSNGTLYKNSGLVEQKDTPPSYYYFKRNESIRYSRSCFQKHKLKNKLEYYNDELSESDLMEINGYGKIWDCGNKKFVAHFDK